MSKCANAACRRRHSPILTCLTATPLASWNYVFKLNWNYATAHFTHRPSDVGMPFNMHLIYFLFVVHKLDLDCTTPTNKMVVVEPKQNYEHWIRMNLCVSRVSDKDLYCDYHGAICVSAARTNERTATLNHREDICPSSCIEMEINKVGEWMYVWKKKKWIPAKVKLINYWITDVRFVQWQEIGGLLERLERNSYGGREHRSCQYAKCTPRTVGFDEHGRLDCDRWRNFRHLLRHEHVSCRRSSLHPIQRAAIDLFKYLNNRRCLFPIYVPSAECKRRLIALNYYYKKKFLEYVLEKKFSIWA